MPEVKVSELNIHYELDDFTNPPGMNPTPSGFNTASAGAGDSASVGLLLWPASTGF